MSIGKDFFKNLFGRVKVKKSGDGYSFTANFSVIGVRLDRAQDILDAQIWQDMEKYMPIDTGTLRSETARLNASTRGEVYIYPPDSDYGHYMYEGIKYVDPVYGVSGWYGILEGKEGQWWSRKGVKKVPSGQPLQYTSPSAQAHWDEVAYNNHHNQWVKVARRALYK